MGSDYELCLMHYRIMFPDVGSLGVDMEKWAAEYARLVRSGLSATLILEQDADGARIRTERNFDQKVMMRALIARRAELEPSFGATLPRRGIGTVVRLGL